jgi:hypothetical protein
MSSDPNTAPDAGNTAPVMSNRSSQPSLLNIKSIPTNSLMRVESDVLEPLTFSQSEAVFELAAKGFLHPGSSIEIGLSLGTAVRAFPYLGVGIHSIVRRAVLRTTAGRVINDTDDWGNLQAIKSMFKSNSSNKEREQYTSGRQVDFEVQYAVGSDIATTNRVGVAAGEGGYGICNNLEYSELASAEASEGSQGANVQSHLLNTKQSTFQIKLAELFPYMEAGNQLPLFLLPNEKIQIVLYWADTLGTNRLAISEPDTAAHPNVVLNVERTKCKFIADYTFYDGELMDRFREEYKTGMTFQYNDTRLSKQTVTVANAVSNVRNLGGNGMLVDNVMWGYNSTNNSEDNLLGKFTGEAPTAVGVSRNRLTSNLFINSEFLYPQSVSNPARQFHNLKEASGAVPFISRQCYSGQGIEGLVSGGTVHAFEGRGQAADLAGQFFHQGFRTSGLGRRIDNNGIRLHSSATIGQNHDQRAWLSIRRYVVISDGHLDCYFM